MSEPLQLATVLREIARDGLRQERPYPVVVPATVDEAVRCVRAARDHGFTVLPLGAGSSFAPDFTLRRTNVMAISSARLTGLERISPFAVRVLSGTASTSLFRGVEALRKTVGGVVCDAPRGNGNTALRLLWRRVRRLQWIDGSGEVRSLTGPNCADADDPALASLVIGSRGRLGFVVSLELAGAFPIQPDDENGVRSDPLPTVTETVAGRADVQRVLDASGLFNW